MLLLVTCEGRVVVGAMHVVVGEIHFAMGAMRVVVGAMHVAVGEMHVVVDAMHVVAGKMRLVVGDVHLNVSDRHLWWVRCMLLLIVVGEMRPPQREACRQAVMALALEAVLRPVLKVRHPLALFTLICNTFTHMCAGKVGR